MFNRDMYPVASSMKFPRYKERFYNISNIIGTPECNLLINTIQQKIPHEEKDGFHRVYLVANLVFEVLQHITEKEYLNYSPLQQIIFRALFLSEIEEQVGESIDNCSIEKNKKIFRKNRKKLLNILDRLFINKEAILNQKENETFFNELKKIKIDCQSFIEFYKKNKEALDKIPQCFSDQFFFDTCRITEINEKDEKYFLDDQEAKENIKPINGTVIINGMGPCFGLIIVGFNNKGEPLCTIWHIDPTEMDEQLYDKILTLVNNLKNKGYSNNLTIFLTGGSLSNLSEVLKLIKCFIEESNPKLTIVSYMFPLVEAYCSHCVLSFLPDNKINITVATQYHENDSSLQDYLEKYKDSKDSDSKDSNSKDSDSKDSDSKDSDSKDSDSKESSENLDSIQFIKQTEKNNINDFFPNLTSQNNKNQTDINSKKRKLETNNVENNTLEPEYKKQRFNDLFPPPSPYIEILHRGNNVFDDAVDYFSTMKK